LLKELALIEDSKVESGEDNFRPAPFQQLKPSNPPHALVIARSIQGQKPKPKNQILSLSTKARPLQKQRPEPVLVNEVEKQATLDCLESLQIEHAFDRFLNTNSNQEVQAEVESRGCLVNRVESL
jgi:hypothetical protein